MIDITEWERFLINDGIITKDLVAMSPEDTVAEMNKLTDALAFYADPETYFAIGVFPDPPCGDFINDYSDTPALGQKPGKTARNALGIEDDQ